MATVGVVEYKISVDTKSMKAQLMAADKEVESFSESTANKLEKGSNKASHKVASAFGTMGSVIKKTTLIAGAAAAAATTKFVLWNGAMRALNIEDAQAKLKGLGHDTASVTKIMDSALAAVKGTAYGLDAAATIAASAVAAGVKPGKELEKYLKLTADAATIAGTSLDDMGAILNKVTTGGRAYTMEIQQLADRGLPVWQWLQKEYGVTAEELRKMVSKGEVDSATFRKVIEQNIGGAALASGSTTRGAWANMQAALARVGAAIANEIIPKIRDSLGRATEFFDNNSTSIVNFALAAITVIGDLAEKFIDFGRAAWDHLGPKINNLWVVIQRDLIPQLSNLWHNYISPMIPVIGTILVVAIGLAIDAFAIIIQSISWLSQEIRDGNPLVMGLAGAFVFLAGVKGVLAAVSAIQFFTNTTIPLALQKVAALRLALATPMVMAAIGVAAALAALQLVINKHKETQRIIDETNRAMRTNEESSRRTTEGIKKRADEGKITQEQLQGYMQATSRIAANEAQFLQNQYSGAIGNVKLWLDNLMGSDSAKKYSQMKNASGGGWSSGGFTGRGGVHEPAGIVHKGEYVLPQSMVDQRTGLPKYEAFEGMGSTTSTEYNIGTITISSEVDGERWLKRLTNNTEIVSRGIVPRTDYSQGF